MKTECKNLEFDRKSTVTYEIIIEEDGVGIDVTGWSIYMTVKEKYEDGDSASLLDKTITAHVDGVNGVILIELSSDDTDIDAGNYPYSIDYKDDEGNEGIFYKGYLKIVEPLRKDRN
ncbi:hypothetical protein LCGC14_0910220 [marine sediment metagenome]|uniref:BppU N-terminal domain-containing protein n=1 Tax=marine sediment metagenome TaxID=412755 RepID=A0A0F9PEL1_9ZZZZ